MKARKLMEKLLGNIYENEVKLSHKSFSSFYKKIMEYYGLISGF